ncbi:MAG TPA: hypothetical protein PLI22_08415 [Caldisericia bacterium]|nr:hypothetical protein [Caldisericia bacterium]
MEEIKYNPEFLEIVNDLTPITNHIVFEKNESSVIVLRQNMEKTVNYVIKAPKEYFDFPTESFAFYDYGEFFKFLKCFSAPKLYTDGTIISINDDTSNIEYLLSDRNSLFKRCEGKNFNFKNVDIKFTLSKQDLDTITKMVSSFQSQRIQIYGDHNELYIKIGTNEKTRSNSFCKKFDFENVSKFEGEYDFMIHSQIFKDFLPKRKIYEVEIIRKGFMKIHLVNENNIDLNIFTTYITGKGR